MKKRALDDVPSLKRNPASHNAEEKYGKGNDPEPASLEEKDSNNLTNEGEVETDINDNKPGYTNGRRRGEEGINKG